MKNSILIIIGVLVTSMAGFAQGERKDKTAVTYEEIYDEPYSVNKVFVHLQPLYGELYATNVNAGFGLQVDYYYKDKADFRAHFRKSYSSKFFDLSRDAAIKGGESDNDPKPFTYFEFGGTYHVKDFESSSKTNMILYKNSYKGNKWAARVPLNAEVPCKVRKIYGVRLGSVIWNSSVDLGRALKDQELTNADLKTSEGISLPDQYTVGANDFALDPFSNLSSVSAYLGGSMTWIKNIAVNFDKFEEGVDDLIFTAFFDLMFAPSFKIDDVVYTGIDNNGNKTGATNTYSVDAVNVKKIGFRAGIDGKFNRQWSWSYGAEFGYRPGIEGKNFFVLAKISFPVFGTNLDYKVESFGK